MIPQGTLPWQPIKVEKSAFFADQSTLSCYHSETDCNIANFTNYKRFDKTNFSTSCTILVTFGPENPEFTLLTIAPFAATRQKSVYHIKYLKMSWTYLDLLYRFGMGIGGDNYPNIYLAVAQGPSLWQRVKFGGFLQTLPGMIFTVRFYVREWIGHRRCFLKRLNGNIRATFYTNLLSIHPIISEFTLLKHAIFATICPQFYDKSLFVTLEF